MASGWHRGSFKGNVVGSVLLLFKTSITTDSAGEDLKRDDEPE